MDTGQPWLPFGGRSVITSSSDQGIHLLAGRMADRPGHPGIGFYSAAHVGGQVAGQSQLGVGGEDQPGPGVGRPRVAQVRGGPAQSLFQGPASRRQGQRPAQPAPARPRPEPDLVLYRRPGLRAALYGHARPHRVRPPLETQAAAPAPFSAAGRIVRGGRYIEGDPSISAKYDRSPVVLAGLRLRLLRHAMRPDVTYRMLTRPSIGADQDEESAMAVVARRAWF
jgi:hypothetical protein